MSSMLLRSTIVGIAAAVLAAAPAFAQPQLVEPLKPCYVVAQENQRELVTVHAAGFTALSRVDIFLDDVLQDQPSALIDGHVKGTVRAPFEEEGTRPFTLRIAEHGAPANTVTATTMVTRLAVEQTPQRASTAQRVRFEGRGFLTLTTPVYAHYVFAGKARKTVRLGLPKGPCGTFSVRRKQFPFKRSPSEGRWTIQFDQHPQYDPKAAVRVPMTIRVRRTAG
ncbi:hypothetical protein DVA67_012335 [Solirubrobacter sp. CPCC 204708]|uniref:Uncharacterized protein n=1 Tax=Solirubrobacter deserti TaxID=2282478 RepID=A0ABT4RM07_9ACTN|nr:hypothetical protein [Solirubrobacter deserti]MBE2316763.1 hypothetical protein [Solirubrobacter deserti]MDA0139520.1 hypothetical protein [Solirubrobacter deserti]